MVEGGGEGGERFEYKMAADTKNPNSKQKVARQKNNKKKTCTADIQRGEREGIGRRAGCCCGSGGDKLRERKRKKILTTLHHLYYSLQYLVKYMFVINLILMSLVTFGFFFLNTSSEKKWGFEQYRSRLLDL